MKRMKYLVFALVLMISAWALAGCGGMSEDEAKEYAQAVLDASYKGEFDSYMELTDSTEEEAREMYEGNMDATMAVVGFEELGASRRTGGYRRAGFGLSAGRSFSGQTEKRRILPHCPLKKRGKKRHSRQSLLPGVSQHKN